MKRKNEYNYFDAFAGLSKYSYNLAETLHSTLSNFDASHITERVASIHEIEHNADLAKHEIINRLVKEFLPPIEREDIITLTQEIDDVTDSVEDVLIYIDMFNIQAIRPEILKFTQLIVALCKAMDEALEEFKNFKSSKKLREKTIEINRLEEEGDALYVASMRNLYQTSKDPIELMCWTEVLHRLERCCDNCEDVADVLESIVMKNS
jgi:predicted phosphate transport protein (TIGR00153 family)